MAEVYSTAQGDEACDPSSQQAQQQQQQQQQLPLANGDQLLQLSISKAFIASDIIINAAESSRLYAVGAIVEAPDEPWRRPKRFSVPISVVNGVMQQIDIEEFLSQVVLPDPNMSAAAFLSSDDTDVWQAVHLVYGDLLFREAVSSRAQTVSRAAKEVSVIFALKRHLVAVGQHVTLHSQLAGVQGQGNGEISPSLLGPLLPVVQHDLSTIWARCTPPGGGKRSVRIFSLELLQVQEQYDLLPTVAKVVASFAAAGRYDGPGMVAARQAVCSSDPATKGILEKQVRMSDEGRGAGRQGTDQRVYVSLGSAASRALLCLHSFSRCTTAHTPIDAY
jgi:hypothetical protein